MKYIYLPPLLTRIAKITLTTTSVICLMAVAILAFALKVPVFNTWQAFTILTGSMEPTIPTNSLLITRIPDQAGSIQVGDIITFKHPRNNQELITHRVHEIPQTGSYITKGDANTEPDPWTVSFSRVVGLAKWHSLAAGKFIAFAQSPLGLALFVLLPVAIIIWQEGRNIVNILVEHKLERFFKHLRRAGYQVIPPGAAIKAPPQPPPNPTRAHTVTHHHVHRKTITQPTRKITVTAAAILLTLAAAPALARFISNSVTIANNTISTAAVFPSASPSPSPSTSTSPNPSTSPDPSATTNPSPSPTPDPSGEVLGNCDTNVDLTTNLSNANTGPNSTNTNEVEVNANCNQTETNQAQITNTIDIDANTGENQQNQNTEQGNHETGDVTIDLNINTEANTQ